MLYANYNLNISKIFKKENELKLSKNSENVWQMNEKPLPFLSPPSSA